MIYAKYVPLRILTPQTWCSFHLEGPSSTLVALYLQWSKLLPSSLSNRQIVGTSLRSCMGEILGAVRAPIRDSKKGATITHRKHAGFLGYFGKWSNLTCAYFCMGWFNHQCWHGLLNAHQKGTWTPETLPYIAPVVSGCNNMDLHPYFNPSQEGPIIDGSKNSIEPSENGNRTYCKCWGGDWTPLQHSLAIWLDT